MDRFWKRKAPQSDTSESEPSTSSSLVSEGAESEVSDAYFCSEEGSFSPFQPVRSSQSVESVNSTIDQDFTKLFGEDASGKFIAK
ncbi:unnamed protein product [Arctogadus glacialis]